MCKWGKTTRCGVWVHKDDSHTGEEYLAVKAVDSCLSDIVTALNKNGIKTRACCCGHGKNNGIITLHDGRELCISNKSII